jgi:transcription-repair coupling factor (superfamily II helicase)
VHLEHGIGIYRGHRAHLRAREHDRGGGHRVRGGDRLNVPLYRIDQIERYAVPATCRPTCRRRGCTSSAATGGSSSARRRAWRSSR